MHYVHLFEGTALYGGSTVQDIDLANSGGSSKFNLQGYVQGEPTYKETWANSPLADSRRLVAYRLDVRQTVITFDITATSIDDLLTQINTLNAYCLKVRDAQVMRNAGQLGANFFWLAERPLNTATKTYKTEILAATLKLPQDFYGTLMLASAGEKFQLTLTLAPYSTASTITVLNGVSANNGAGDYVDVGASGGTSITGDLPAPLKLKVAGGGSTTTRLLAALRYRGTPSNFKQTYWGKDATLTANTAARNADTTFDGNTSHNGTRTTAANTSENLTHRWTNSTNATDQFGRFQYYGRFRSNTAGRYSVRLRQGLTDGTNDVFPASGGYLTATANAIGTDSGNALAWVYLGEGVVDYQQAVYGIVYQLYTTCSDTTGSPTMDFDGLWLFPIGEGPVGTGLVQATYDLGSGAAGVSSANLSALPGDPPAYLANGSDVVTFPTICDGGQPLFGIPQRAARLFAVLIDATNSRHDYSTSLTETLVQELRNSTVIGA